MSTHCTLILGLKEMDPVRLHARLVLSPEVLAGAAEAVVRQE